MRIGGWLEKERAWIDHVLAEERCGALTGAEAEARNWHSTLFARFCFAGFQALDRKLQALLGPQRKDHRKRRFFIALDECTALGESNPYDPNGQMRMLPEDEILLGAMWRILKAADILHTKRKTNTNTNTNTKFWFLLLDTDPGPFLRPPGSTGRKEKLRALPPFVYLGFNQMAPKVMGKEMERGMEKGKEKGKGKGTRYPREALQLKYLKMYGRPVSLLLLESNHHALLIMMFLFLLNSNLTVPFNSQTLFPSRSHPHPHT